MDEDSNSVDGEGYELAVGEEESSPLVAALRAHLAKYYGEGAARETRPFSSRNQVIKPLNLDLLDASSIQEMCKTR